jgi:redox-sensitive bicupin YhaK (pirin superfamily)
MKHRRHEWSIISTMKVATGKVVEGKVVVEGVTLEEGSLVTVLARDREQTFQLSADEEAELLLSIAEADRGETLSGEEVLASLPRP